MKAHMDVTMTERDVVTGRKTETGGVRHLLERFRTWIGKYVTVEKDAIFKDPNWPYLWDHKR